VQNIFGSVFLYLVKWNVEVALPCSKPVAKIWGKSCNTYRFLYRHPAQSSKCL
jgi:hypothetical protein